MDLHVSVPGGTAIFTVTAPDGTSHPTFSFSDYVVKFIEPRTAHELYMRLDGYSQERIDHLVAKLPQGYRVDLPLLDLAQPGELVCRTDAHVLQAMFLLGAECVPVFLPHEHAALAP